MDIDRGIGGRTGLQRALDGTSLSDSYRDRKEQLESCFKISVSLSNAVERRRAQVRRPVHPTHQVPKKEGS